MQLNRLAIAFFLLSGMLALTSSWVSKPVRLQEPSKSQDRGLPAPDRGSVSGQRYENKFLEFTFELPPAWTAWSPEELKKLDETNRQQSIVSYGPNAKKLFDSGVLTFTGEWTILYAIPSQPSAPGSIPSAPIISLTVEEGNPFQRGTVSGHSGEDPIDKYFPYSDVMQTGALATTQQYRSYHLERKPTSQTLGGRKFVRADFRIKRKGGIFGKPESSLS